MVLLAVQIRSFAAVDDDNLQVAHCAAVGGHVVPAASYVEVARCAAKDFAVVVASRDSKHHQQPDGHCAAEGAEEGPKYFELPGHSNPVAVGRTVAVAAVGLGTAVEMYQGPLPQPGLP